MNIIQFNMVTMKIVCSSFKDHSYKMLSENICSQQPIDNHESSDVQALPFHN